MKFISRKSADQPASRIPVEARWKGTPSRWRASAWHLMLSAALAVLLLAAMLEIWFPRPLFEAAGGANLLFILVSVDIVIGPLITLIIFDAARKTARTLRLDLAVIALLQLSALGYGIYTLFEARPVFLVYTNDRLDVVTPSDIPPEEMARVELAEFRRLPLLGPRLVAVEPPADRRERERIMFSALAGGPDLQCFPQYYRPFASAAKSVLARARPVSELIKRHPEGAPELTRRANSLGRSVDELRYLPVRAKVMDFVALVDAASASVLGYAVVDPW